MNTVPKMQEIKERLGADSVSKSGDVIFARWGFFYTHGKTSADYVSKVKAEFPGFLLIGHGQFDKPFRGGASVANNSHFYVKFALHSIPVL